MNPSISLLFGRKTGAASRLVAVALAVSAAMGEACTDVENDSVDIPIGSTAPAARAGSNEINPRLLHRFKALDRWLTDDGASPPPARVALGKRLFTEKSLSKDGSLSCAGCHDLDHYGVDGRSTSLGVGGQRGKRNAPSVYNAAAAFSQFWDGRAETVEAQALGPMLNPAEMALTDGNSAVAVLKADPTYLADFHAAFPGDPDPLTFDHVGIAIGAFERTLTTPSRWDRFLAGDHSALSSPEKAGLKTFLNVGCMVCHTGVLVGGSMFERVGVVEPWPNQADQGRFDITHQEGDRMSFKVPSLRNVAMTAPYFHDGSVDNLEDAIRAMGRHQLGVSLAPEEVTGIAAWLGSLTGETGAGGASPAPTHASPVVAAAPSGASAPHATCRAGGVCPLQAWMRGNAVPAIQSNDPARLERVFTQIAALAPSGFDRWAAIAAQGAEAARNQDVDGARAACSSCHSAYADRYQSSSDRGRALR